MAADRPCRPPLVLVSGFWYLPIIENKAGRIRNKYRVTYCFRHLNYDTNGALDISGLVHFRHYGGGNVVLYFFLALMDLGILLSTSPGNRGIRVQPLLRLPVIWRVKYMASHLFPEYSLYPAINKYPGLRPNMQRQHTRSQTYLLNRCLRPLHSLHIRTMKQSVIQ